MDQEDVVHILIYIYIHTHIYTHTHTHTHTMEYYSVIKKNEILPLATAMDRLEGYYAKWNKSEKSKYCMIAFICGT